MNNANQPLQEENKEPVRLLKPISDMPKGLRTLLSSPGFVEAFANQAAREYFSHRSAMLNWVTIEGALSQLDRLRDREGRPISQVHTAAAGSPR